MRVWKGCVSACVLAASLTAAAPPEAAKAFGCPPSKTLTVESPETPSLVLAEGPAHLAEPVAGPFNVPWSFAFLPDGSFLVTERPGNLRHVRPGFDPQTVSGTPSVLYFGHGGLLDVAVDPEFATNGLIYFSYLQGSEAASTLRVMRAKYDIEHETLTDQQVIFESTPGEKHDQIGARLALTGDGYLFISMGDRWDGARAQNVSDHAGKILRIRTDGTIPEDNPFRYRVGAQPEIWSYGHRNPQGLVYDRATGRLWAHEHGPQGGDELNLVVKGANYGWPYATYGVDYTGRPIAVSSTYKGTTQPAHYWAPLSIAPSGLAMQTQGDHSVVWMGTLAAQMLVRLELANGCVVSEKHLLVQQLGRIRDVRLDATGTPYVLTDGGKGMLYRVDRGTTEDATHL